MAVQLGAKGTDTITGFTGVVTGLVQYLTGCNQVLLTPPISKDGNARDSAWFDEQRVKIDPRTKAIALDNGKTPGFDKPAPIR